MKLGRIMKLLQLFRSFTVFFLGFTISSAFIDILKLFFIVHSMFFFASFYFSSSSTFSSSFAAFLTLLREFLSSQNLTLRSNSDQFLPFLIYLFRPALPFATRTFLLIFYSVYTSSCFTLLPFCSLCIFSKSHSSFPPIPSSVHIFLI